MADEKQAEVSDTGIWVDNETGKVVTSQPKEGVQLVPPGGEMRPDRKAAVEAAKVAADGGADVAVDLSPPAEPAAEPVKAKAPAKKAAPKAG